MFFSVLGPGFITAMVDNDAGGIFTYSQAGARFGYLPLWTLIPITILLIVTQEMCSRMGAITEKGLSDLIREEYGLRTTFFIMAALVAANLTNVMANFAGIASSLELFHVSRFVSVPIGATVVWLLVVKGTYDRRREGLPVRDHALRRLHRRRHPGEARLGTGGALQRQAGARLRARLPHDADRDGGHVGRAVDAVLPAGRDRRERA